MARAAIRRLVWLVAVVAAIVFVWSRSLVLTSEPIGSAEFDAVVRAIGVLQRGGFSREATLLRRFANYRATDNWWNVYVGHHDAYAATNFPLGIVTLYQPFVDVATDDVERAAILLHEAQHLGGSGEDAALAYVWREKARIGWTADVYGGTRLWRNTREWTIASAPSLFRCGRDAQSDCVP